MNETTPAQSQPNHQPTFGSAYVFAQPLWPELEAYEPPHGFKDWEAIRPLALHVVAAIASHGLPTAATWPQHSRGFISWAWKVLGCELDLEDIFTESNLQLYREHRSKRLAPTTLQHEVLLLSRMVKAVTGTRPAGYGRVERMTDPYTQRELAAVWSTAAASKSASRRRDAQRIVALCAGAGLTASEMVLVRNRDLHPAHINVGGTYARTAPLLPGWHDELPSDGDADEFVLFTDYAGKQDRTRLLLRTALAALPEPRPNTNRLRATYITTLISAGISAQDLASVLGVQRPGAAMDRFRAYWPDRSADIVAEVARLFGGDAQ